MDTKAKKLDRILMNGPALATSESNGERIGLWHLLLALLLLLFLAETARPQDTGKPPANPSALTPVTIVVSVETKHGMEMPVLYPEDVRVFQGRDRLKVTQWVPLEQSQTGLELMILVDDACDTSGVGLQLDDLKKFINAQTNEIAIGVGYIHNSTVEIRQNPTREHVSAAKALRLPLGYPATESSPYLAIADLTKEWPDIGNHRIIFLVSSGVDGLDLGPTSVYLDNAIERVQKAKIPVYSIYCSRTGYAAPGGLWDFGQSHLLELAERTGGDVYFQGSHTPLSFSPFLQEFGNRLKHQYRLTFLAVADEKDTTQHIRLETEVPNVELVGPDRVRIPGINRRPGL